MALRSLASLEFEVDRLTARLRSSAAPASALVLAACGGSPPQAPPRPLAVVPVRAPMADAGAAPDALPSLDAIAERGSRASPAMAEAARTDSAGVDAITWEAARPGADACVRLAFAADAPVRVALEDARGNVVLAEVFARDGLVGERGPVCVRAGGVVVARVTGGGPLRVRMVSWTSQAR